MRCIGNYATSPAGKALLADADLLVSLGTHFRSNETSDYRLELPPRTCRSTSIPPHRAACTRRPYRWSATWPRSCGPCSRRRTSAGSSWAMSIWEGHLAGTEWTARAEQTREQVRATQRKGLGDHAALCDAVRAVLPDDAVVARDVTIASSAWGNRLLPMYDPRSNVFPRGGGIGQGLGMAIGAAIADEGRSGACGATRERRPTLGLVGDGGLAVHFGELLTMAQEKPWLVLLVPNDAGYGVLRNMQRGSGSREYAVDLHTPDFAKLADAIGVAHRVIRGAAEAESVLADAVALRGPVIVEVDLAAYGPMPAPFTPPVTVPGQ